MDFSYDISFIGNNIYNMTFVSDANNLYLGKLTYEFIGNCASIICLYIDAEYCDEVLYKDFYMEFEIYMENFGITNILINIREYLTYYGDLERIYSELGFIREGTSSICYVDGSCFRRYKMRKYIRLGR